MTPTPATRRTNGDTSPEIDRRLEIEDHLTRLADLLQLIAAATDGVPPPTGPPSPEERRSP